MNPSPYPAPYNSAHGRARIVKILLAVGAIATAMSLLCEALSLAFPPLREEQELGDNPIGAVVVLLTALVALLEFFIYLVTVIFFLMWLYRAYNNLRVFNSWDRPTYSPGFAVGSFFIPFANLVIPYRVVKETWQKSGMPDEGYLAATNPPSSFPIWWLFWLLAGFANNISIRLSFSDGVPANTATMVSIVASALSILAAVFAYLVVDAIDQKQEETSAKLKLGQFPAPPPPPSDLSVPNVMTHYE